MSNLRFGDFQELCRRYPNFKNGEKTKFRGCINTWSYHDNAWWFVYKQKYFGFKKEKKLLYAKTGRWLTFNEWIAKTEWFDFPLLIYNQRIIVIRVYQWDKNQYRTCFLTLDDDSGYDFMFPSEKLKEVKKFLETNRHDKNFGQLIIDFIDNTEGVYYW